MGKQNQSIVFLKISNRDGRELRCRICRNARKKSAYHLTKFKDQEYLKTLLRLKPAYRMVSRAKERATKISVPFDLDWREIVVPTHCPILGIELSIGDGKMHDASPSLDRIIPSKGYTKGKVVMISNRANRIKNDSTLAELIQLVEWMKNVC